MSYRVPKRQTIKAIESLKSTSYQGSKVDKLLRWSLKLTNYRGSKNPKAIKCQGGKRNRMLKELKLYEYEKLSSLNINELSHQVIEC